MSKKKSKLKKKLNKQSKIKNVQSKKIENNLENIRKDIKNITDNNVEEEIKLDVEEQKNDNKIKTENLSLAVLKDKKDKCNKKLTNKIIINFKILFKFIIISFGVSFIYSIFMIFTITFLILSIVGVGIFSIGIIGVLFNITNLITKMGAVACIFIGNGSICLGIFLMTLFIEFIKKFIRYVKNNFKRLTTK